MWDEKIFPSPLKRKIAANCSLACEANCGMLIDYYIISTLTRCHICLVQLFLQCIQFTYSCKELLVAIVTFTVVVGPHSIVIGWLVDETKCMHITACMHLFLNAFSVRFLSTESTFYQQFSYVHDQFYITW